MGRTEKTDAAGKVLAAVQDHFARHKAMPSFADVARAVGVSTSTVAFHIEALKVNGYLGATATGRLVPGKAFFQRALVSSVRAGLPDLVEEGSTDAMPIDDYLVDTPSRTFLLSVKGESMVEAGIFPGDILVVKRGALAVPGDIVVVNANGEGTVKELAQDESGELYLRARNPAYPDIAPAEGFEVMGVVTGQFRRYGRNQAKRAASARPTLKAV